jgi:hypothetical protein
MDATPGARGRAHHAKHVIAKGAGEILTLSSLASPVESPSRLEEEVSVGMLTLVGVAV